MLENLKKLISFSDKLKVLFKRFWSNNKTKPIPNSTAERTRKKKVRESTFKLSKIKPESNEIA